MNRALPHAPSDPARRFPGRVAIIGNDPALGAVSDAADHVVRFNNAPGFGGKAGGRITQLVLVNRGGQMREWLDDPGFLDRPALRAARSILLAFPELAPDVDRGAERVCWTREARARLGGLGVPVAVLPQAVHDRARASLRPWSAAPNPSTGFLAAFHVLSERGEDEPPVDVHGFGFAGWPGHPWAAERRRFEAWQAAGRVRLHPPGAGA